MRNTTVFKAWLDAFEVTLEYSSADEFGLILQVISDHAEKAGEYIEILSRDDTMSRVAVKLEEARSLWSKRLGN